MSLHCALPRNLWANLAYGCLTAAANSLILGPFFSNYIIGIGLNYENVGYIYSLAGLVMVIMAVPMGILTDKLKHQTLLRVGALLGIVTSFTNCVALQLRSVTMLYVSAALSGVTNATVGPALAANFADSISTGSRSWMYTIQYSGSLVAGALGPLLALPYIYYHGNDWDVEMLVVIMQAGNGINFVSFLILFLIR